MSISETRALTSLTPRVYTEAKNDEKGKKMVFSWDYLCFKVPEFRASFEGLFDTPLSKIHNKKNTERLQKLFSYFQLKKGAPFTQKSPQEKADSFFNAYRQIFSLWFMGQKNCQEALDSLKTKVVIRTNHRNLDIDQAVKEHIRYRIKAVHSLALERSISKALSVPIDSIDLRSFPDTFKEEPKQPEISEFFNLFFDRLSKGL